MIKHIKFNKKALGEGVEKISDGISSVIEGSGGSGDFVHDASELTKSIVGVGEVVFKFLGIANSAYKLSRLWISKKEKDTNLITKIGLTTLYLGHIALSLVAVAVVLGATVIAGPIAMACVSGISFAINGVELVKKLFQIRKIKKELKVKDKELEKSKVDFNLNLGLYKDITQSRSEIRALEEQIHAINLQISHVGKLKPEDELQDRQKLEDIVNARKDRLYNEMVAEGLIAQDSTLSSKSQVVKFKAALTELEKQKTSAIPANQEKIDKKIAIVNMLIHHYASVSRLEDTLTEVIDQQRQLDIKYSKKPYLNLNKETIEKLKRLENEYLNERKEQLSASIKTASDPQIHIQNRESQSDELQTLQMKKNNVRELQKVYLEALQKEQNSFVQTLDAKKEILDNKSKYLKALFSSPNKNTELLQDLKENIHGKKDDFSQKMIDKIDKENELKREIIARNKKIKNTVISGAILGLAVCLCIPPLWPAAGIISGVMIGVGAVALVSALYDSYQRRKVNRQAKEQKEIALKEIDAKMDETVITKKKVTFEDSPEVIPQVEQAKTTDVRRELIFEPVVPINGKADDEKRDKPEEIKRDEAREGLLDKNGPAAKR